MPHEEYPVKIFERFNAGISMFSSDQFWKLKCTYNVEMSTDTPNTVLFFITNTSPEKSLTFLVDPYFLTFFRLEFLSGKEGTVEEKKIQKQLSGETQLNAIYVMILENTRYVHMIRKDVQNSINE